MTAGSAARDRAKQQNSSQRHHQPASAGIRHLLGQTVNIDAGWITGCWTLMLFPRLAGPRLTLWGDLLPDSRPPPFTPEDLPMNGPAKNRLYDYDAGWLTLLLKMGVASEKALEEAQNRVAQQAIDEMNERRERRRQARKRKG